MNELIDTTEMYLKTVFELAEEGVPALRARIVERLGQSGPTVSETVARLERDGLLTMPDGKHIEFTDKGRTLAFDVMRRHRIAECLLTNVLQLPLPKVHSEACRWEHAISDEVSERMASVLNNPKTDPFGNPIPPKNATAQKIMSAAELGLFPLSQVACSKISGTAEQKKIVEVLRFAETLQLCAAEIELFANVGLLPGSKIVIQEMTADDVFVDIGAEKLAIPLTLAAKIFVRESN